MIQSQYLSNFHRFKEITTMTYNVDPFEYERHYVKERKIYIYFGNIYYICKCLKYPTVENVFINVPPTLNLAW